MTYIYRIYLKKTFKNTNKDITNTFHISTQLSKSSLNDWWWKMLLDF